MSKQSENLKIIAKEAAQGIIDEATKVAAKLSADTALDINYIKNDIKEIKVMLDRKYVTKEEFASVKLIAYGVVGIIMMSVIGAIMVSVLKK